MVKMKASQALVQVLANWQIDHVYGIPADSLIDGFAAERNQVRYIQVRHEEVGALAAAAEAKLTGKIGVALASVGPGALHLLYGLCDAKMDHAPMLVIMSNVATSMMNTHYLQDMNEDELFAGLDTYHVQVSDAKQIPTTIQEAIQVAYETKMPSVVIIPDDLANYEIESPTLPVVQPQTPVCEVHGQDVLTTASLIQAAQRPVMLVGTGVRHAQAEVVAVSEKYGLPVIPTAPAVGYVPSQFKNNLGPAGRIGTQPAHEALKMADLIVMVGSNYPFLRFLPNQPKVVQIDRSASALGVQSAVTQAVQADAKKFLDQLLNVTIDEQPATPFLLACQQSRRNWHHYLDQQANDRPNGLLTAEAVLQALQPVLKSDAVYGLDIGNNTIWSVRNLPFSGQQAMTMSAWLGAMGYGIAAGIAAQISYPNRQVVTISGDGGFSMVVQDLLTQVQYQLPVLNVVLENGGYGFIRQEKAKTGQTDYALTFKNANWAGVAENMGAIGLRVTDDASLASAIAVIAEHFKKGVKIPIVLDAIISDQSPLDTSEMLLDEQRDGVQAVADYRKANHLPADQYPSLRTLMNQFTN